MNKEIEVQKIKALSSLQRMLVQLLSISYYPLSLGQLQLCLNAWIQIKHLNQAQLTEADLQVLIEPLSQEGLLNITGLHKIQIPLSLIEKISHTLELPQEAREIIDILQQNLGFEALRVDKKPKNFHEGIRDLRWALYSHRTTEFNKLINTLQNYFPAEFRQRNPWFSLFDEPFDPIIFNQWPKSFALSVAATVLMLRVNRMEPCAGVLSWLRDEARAAPKEQRHWFASVLSEPLVVQGYLAEAVELAKTAEGEILFPIQGLIDVLCAQFEKSEYFFSEYLEHQHKPINLKKIGMSGLSGVAYVISLIVNSTPKNLERASSHIAQVIKGGTPLMNIYAHLGEVAHASSSLNKNTTQSRVPTSIKDPLGVLFSHLTQWWIDADPESWDKARLQEYAQYAETFGYRWLASEFWALLSVEDNLMAQKRSDLIHYELGTQTLLHGMKPQTIWERTLSSLERLGTEPLAHKDSSPKKYRLAWFLEWNELSQRFGILAKEFKKQGGATSVEAKIVAWNKLILPAFESQHELLEADHNVIQLVKNISLISKNIERRLEDEALLACLVGHPHVYIKDTHEYPVLLKRRPIWLTLKKESHQLLLTSEPIIPNNQHFVVQRESTDRLAIYEVEPAQKPIMELLQGQEHVFPLESESRLLQAITALNTRMPLYSELDETYQLTPVQNTDIYALLTPVPSGLEMELMIYPEGEHREGFRPGVGPSWIISTDEHQDDKPRLLLRSLSLERKKSDLIWKKFSNWLKTDPISHTHTTPTLASACELLWALKETNDVSLHLRWPRGETLKIGAEVSRKQLQIQLDGEGDWLKIQGELTVDAQTVIELSELVRLASQSKNRFIPLNERHFVALSQDLWSKIREMGMISEPSQDGLRLHPLMVTELSQIMDTTDSDLVNDDADGSQVGYYLKVQEQIQNWKPSVPPDLKAVLRDYQIHGFEWLIRLAEIQAGACLADDMGLGKTIQTLAVLLYRSEMGPALVVAPTSVCGNWLSEALRFAPSLQCQWLTQGSDWPLLEKSKLGQVWIISYNLFQQMPDDLLNDIHWGTVVLDEAQNIKNPLTKRSQTAMKLKAQFRLVTTGTPIENHLGELWNLFRFINPGLLGSHKSFNERFAFPIQREGDLEILNHLKQIISPFILRRTKTQVLVELPERTEMTIVLSMNEEERALYEAVRQEALNTVIEFQGQSEPSEIGRNRVRILAGLMKMRRACCHGRLLLPESSWESSKLVALMDIIQDLVASGHRALIFSQFVDYLQIIKKLMEHHEIGFQYLDGSTPAGERTKRVKAFQEGKDEVFLISLKAGGVGLNLTGADYVIHMDPWWNPAVEDQASDRAHRFGQTKPVTIYRLICKNTIEEKMLVLHEKKRGLAESLLNGAEQSTPLNLDELKELLNGDA